MQLNRDQFKQLTKALEGAFVTRAQLERLTLGAFNKSLDQVAMGDDLEEIIVRMIKVAELTNRLPYLIEEAYDMRPQDRLLSTFFEDFKPIIAEENRDHYEALLLRGDRVLVNRRLLRDTLRGFDERTGKPILIVDGPPSSGKTHSRYFITYLESTVLRFKTIVIDLTHLAASAENGMIGPEDLGQWIAARMGLGKIPDRQKEQDARWVHRFCNWLIEELRNDSQARWIVLDHFDKTSLSQGTQDLIHTLITEIDTNQLNLRMVLLSYKDKNSLPPSITDIVTYEYLTPIDKNDLILFFIGLYEERKRYKQVGCEPKDVAESIHRVWSQIDLSDPRHMKFLGDAIMQEARNVLKPAQPTPEMQAMQALVEEELRRLEAINTASLEPDRSQ